VTARCAVSRNYCCTCKDNRCIESGNTCYLDGPYCLDRTSTGDWLFELGPGPPAKFGRKGGNDEYQTVLPDRWPQWGVNGDDLDMGGPSHALDPGGALGAHGYCNGQCGRTYAAPQNCDPSHQDGSDICGGEDWHKTEMETWRKVTATQKREA
jgi:hypothetical protein